MMPNPSKIPSYDLMFIPTIRALEELGGSGTTDEIFRKVVEILHLPDDVIEVPHGDTARSEVEYRLAWSRTYLKKYGLMDNSTRGIWSLTRKIDSRVLDPREIVLAFRDQNRRQKSRVVEPEAIAIEPEASEPMQLLWHQELQKVLLSMSPPAFERLIQRMLRESGFIQVEVTGKSGDGGIDGIGIARIAGFMSFQVLFQCKRYQGAITPSQIRDFRGAMQGRTDKGLFITTGTFTRDAVKEATRDGAPPIDLIDGEQLVQRLKELRLGVRIEMVEAVEVDKDWFARI
jgi:Restriction endonuclease